MSVDYDAAYTKTLDIRDGLQITRALVPGTYPLHSLRVVGTTPTPRPFLGGHFLFLGGRGDSNLLVPGVTVTSIALSSSDGMLELISFLFRFSGFDCLS